MGERKIQKIEKGSGENSNVVEEVLLSEQIQEGQAGCSNDKQSCTWDASSERDVETKED